ncbi:hypothetical protein FAM09_17215 [Niastella caeni]|uniref:Fibronectin type III domain-containing protein n=1 Tax=Niastella caeni TaxID=2569763 RepID=A0A4S8HUT3_9BACT|nr:hypothetical protein [Niastella caeni]THU38409.1 hypothetical protein FAM09_17215 [Niastella caeni]
MKRRLKLNFKGIKDPELSIMAYTVCHKMNGNEKFPDPGMLIIELSEISRQFDQAMLDASMGDRLKIAIKNDVKALLIKKLKQVGEFVKNEANGKEELLWGSGFDLTKPVDEIKLRHPNDFQILPGSNPGEMILKVRGLKGARSYLYQWTPAPVTSQSIWQSIADTRCKKVITNLPLGIDYCFRMAAVGARNQIIYTQVLSRYIS